MIAVVALWAPTLLAAEAPLYLKTDSSTVCAAWLLLAKNFPIQADWLLQDAAGVQLIASVRRTEAVHVDACGQEGDRFQFPHPLDGEHHFVSYCPYHGANRKVPYAIYFMGIHGHRELLAAIPRSRAINSCLLDRPLCPVLRRLPGGQRLDC
ncbi:MAG: hypothetical protein JXR94_17360 [Candidatus Hydrogenedentes bacterium]|nr:hypothetical protein [Candidatus Hydrogenedentota bacterium]